uniref:Uncharacterized protein n=1 Tax=Octopus bimaculoides TaxID=37653 RepID=A0A0L8HVZ6_OCTBM
MKYCISGRLFYFIIFFPIKHTLYNHPTKNIAAPKLQYVVMCVHIGKRKESIAYWVRNKYRRIVITLMVVCINEKIPEMGRENCVAIH